MSCNLNLAKCVDFRPRFDIILRMSDLKVNSFLIVELLSSRLHYKMTCQATSKVWKTEAMARDIPLKMSCQATSKVWKHDAMAGDIP